MTGIIERLEARHECRMGGEVSVHHLINPDGPEAADLLTECERVLVSAREYIEAYNLQHRTLGNAAQPLAAIDTLLSRIQSSKETEK